MGLAKRPDLVGNFIRTQAGCCWRIAAVNEGTNIHYETTTNGLGEYQVANLPPNSYRIEIEKAGFKKLTKPDVILHVQDALDIDFEVPLGAGSETVTVEGGAPLVRATIGAAEVEACAEYDDLRALGSG